MVRLLPQEADHALLPGMPTNCYLLLTGKGTLVVDPPSSRDESLQELLAAGGPIVAILVTHTHPDHIAGVPGMAARTDAPVYAHPLARPHLAGDFRFLPVSEGDEIAGWRVLYMPGHRPDSLTFYSAENGCAIVGDLIAGSGTVVIDPSEGDLLDYLNSLGRLRDEIRPRLLAPGHGPLVDDPRTLLTYFIEHRLARERRVLGSLTVSPTPLDDLVSRVYADTDPALHPLATRSLLAHLLKLQREGRVKESNEGWSHKS
jgi:glyoxylase-like metal-dependent hydrolase (beta-lactamase superfamily II)